MELDNLKIYMDWYITRIYLNESLRLERISGFKHGYTFEEFKEPMEYPTTFGITKLQDWKNRFKLYEQENKNNK